MPPIALRIHASQAHVSTGSRRGASVRCFTTGVDQHLTPDTRQPDTRHWPHYCLPCGHQTRGSSHVPCLSVRPLFTPFPLQEGRLAPTQGGQSRSYGGRLGVNGAALQCGTDTRHQTLAALLSSCGHQTPDTGRTIVFHAATRPFPLPPSPATQLTLLSRLRPHTQHSC